MLQDVVLGIQARDDDDASFSHSNDASSFIKTMVPILYGTGDWFRGRQFLHGLGKEVVSG